MEKIIKFKRETLAGKISFTYHQDKRLKKIKGVQASVFPVYVQVIFNNRTQNLRSILWKRLTEGNNDFSVSARYDDNGIIEGQTDVLTFLVNDKTSFENMCQYEVDSIMQIIEFVLKNNPRDVKQIAAAYNFWGQDGLREICLNILSKLTEEEDSDLRTEAVTFRSLHKGLSKNAKRIISTLLNGGYDPVSVLGFLDETGVVTGFEKELSPELLDGYYRTTTLIVVLTSYLKVGHMGESNVPILRKSPMPFAIYYFPKINFFFPPRELPQDSALSPASLEKLQKFLSRG